MARLRIVLGTRLRVQVTCVLGISLVSPVAVWVTDLIWPRTKKIRFLCTSLWRTVVVTRPRLHGLMNASIGS